MTGKTMKRARHLLRAGRLTRTDIAVLDCMAHSCRTRGQTAFAVSYTRLARLVRAARGTVIAAVRRLEACGLLTRQRRGRVVAWGTGRAWRQMTNLYRLVTPPDGGGDPPGSEFNPPPVYSEQGRKIAAKGVWTPLPCPHPPVRSVAEQLAMLGYQPS